MAGKTTYKELEQRIEELEKEIVACRHNMDTQNTSILLLTSLVESPLDTIIYSLDRTISFIAILA